jgi:replicative DNA helicase
MNNLKELNSDLPYNLYAEKMVLAAIFLDEKVIYLIAQKLALEAFYIKEHQEIYKAALQLYSEGRIVDYTTLTTYLKDLKVSNKIFDILSEIMKEIVNISNIEEYISLIQEKYIRRLIINLGYSIINTGFFTDISLDKVFEEIEEKIYHITGKKKEDSLLPMSELLSETIIELKKKSNVSSLLGLSSSYYELDNLLQGFQNSDLIILAGRPSIGKTSFALNIAANVAKKYTLPVIIFSLEMSKQQLIYRFLATESGINNNLLRTGRLSQEDWKKVYQSIKNLAALKLFFDDTSNLSITNIRFKIKKLLLQEKELGLVIIDYLQLIQDNKKTQNRVQELSNITRGLKNIAKEFNIPVIVLSQLSRNVEIRTNKKPVLSDLRESGCIYSPIINKHHKVNHLKFKGWDGQQICYVNFNNLRFTGIKPVYKIKTSFGFEISVTANHKLFSNQKWQSISDLNINSPINIELNNQKNEKKLLNDFIIEIQYFGLKKVFDLTIPKTSNYFFNGILNHNSIEQDADVVIMIYREENNEKIKDQDGLVEFIVAKHRNGPTGSFKLKYNSKLTKFINF